MDMGRPHRGPSIEHVPHAESKSVVNQCHVMKPMNDAVNEARKQEQRALMRLGDQRLKGARFAVLDGQEAVPKPNEALLDSSLSSSLMSPPAWQRKESLHWL